MSPRVDHLRHRGDGVVVGLGRADAHHALERHDEDLAVADLAGLRALAQRVDRRLDERVGDRDLEADLLRQAHLHARAAVGLDPVELTAVALHAAERDPAHLGAVERLQHVVRLLRPDDADHELHGPAPPSIGRRASYWARRRAARCSGSPRGHPLRLAEIGGPCVVVTAHTVIPAARAAAMPAGASSNTRHAAGRPRGARRPAGSVGRRLAVLHLVGADQHAGDRPAPRPRAGRARAAPSHEVAIATRAEREHVGRARVGDDAVGVGGLGVGEERRVLLDLRRRPRARRSRRAPGGRGCRPGSPAPSSPWRSPHAAQLRDGRRDGVDEHAVEVGDDRRERHAGTGSCRRRGAGRAACAPRRGRPARRRRRRPRISTASAHGSDEASAAKPISGGPARKPSEPIEDTAPMPGPGGDVRQAAGGAEHQRHAVRDAEADEEQAGQRDRRLADQQQRGKRDAGQQRAAAQQGDGADAVVDASRRARARASCRR